MLTGPEIVNNVSILRNSKKYEELIILKEKPSINGHDEKFSDALKLNY